MKIDKQFFKKYKEKTTKFLKWFFIDVVLERILYDLDLIKFHPTKKLRIDAVTKAYGVRNFKLVLRLKLPLFRRAKLGVQENPQVVFVLLLSAFFPGFLPLTIPFFVGAIAYGETTSEQGGTGTTLSYSHTAAVGDNVVVITGITARDYQQQADSSSVTYGGAGMTKEIQDRSTAANYCYSALFSKGNPASGSQTVAVSYGTTVYTPTSGTMSFTGGNTANVCGATDSWISSIGTYVYQSITTTVDNSMLVDCLSIQYNGSAGARATGQIQRWSEYISYVSGHGSTMPTTDYGSYEMRWDLWDAGPTAWTCVEVLAGIELPTVTTQAVDDIEKTTATGNGNITATGGATVTRRGFAYKVGTSGDPTVSDSTAYDDGSFGTGAYTKGLTGLSAGTGYRVRAYAVNSAGTGYGATVQLTTATAHTKTLSESLSVSDTLSKVPTLLKIDTLNVRERLQSFDITLPYVLPHAMDFGDVLKKDVEIVKSDTLTLAELIYLRQVVTQLLSDSVALTESISKDSSLSKSESFTLTETISRITEAKKILTDSFALTESAVPIVTFIRSLTETLTLTEVVLKEAGLSFIDSLSFIENLQSTIESILTFAESLTLVDLLKKDASLLKTDSLLLSESISPTTSQSITLSDVLTFLTGHPVGYNDSGTLYGDTLTKYNYSPIPVFDVGKFLIQNLLLSETKIAVITYQKVLSDTFSLVDFLSHRTGLNFIESFSLAEVITRISEFKQSFSEAITFSDIFTAVVQFEKTLLEALAIIEDLKKDSDMSFSESLLLVEDIIKQTDAYKTFQEEMSLDENLLKGISFRKSDAFTISDTAKKLVRKDMSENILLSEITTFGGILNQKLYETLTFAEVLKKISGASFADSILLAEVFSSDSRIQVDLMETLTLIENLLKDIRLKKIESLTAAESLVKTSEFFIDKIDVLTLAESIDIFGGLKISLTDTLTLNEALGKALELTKGDTLSFSESFSKAIELQKIEGLNLADVIATAVVVKRALLENLTLTESVSITRQQILSDLLSINEIIKKRFQIPKGETLVLTENLQVGADQHIAQAEVLQLNESLIKLIEIRLIDDFALIDLLTKEIGLTQQDALDFIDSLSFLEVEVSPRSKTHLISKDQETVTISKEQKVIAISKGQKTYLFSKHVNPTTN